MDTKYIELRSFRLGNQVIENLNSTPNDSFEMLVINYGEIKLLISSEAMPLLVDTITKYRNLKKE